jgi:hypothetical protein
MASHPLFLNDSLGMGCFLALLALVSPRLVLFLLWLFSNILSRAFDSWILPLLGFFLLPWTTLAYAAFWDWGPGRHVFGFEWFFVILAFLIDLGSYAGGTASPVRSGVSLTVGSSLRGPSGSPRHSDPWAVGHVLAQAAGARYWGGWTLGWTPLRLQAQIPFG